MELSSTRFVGVAAVAAMVGAGVAVAASGSERTLAHVCCLTINGGAVDLAVTPDALTVYGAQFEANAVVRATSRDDTITVIGANSGTPSPVTRPQSVLVLKPDTLAVGSEGRVSSFGLDGKVGEHLDAPGLLPVSMSATSDGLLVSDDSKGGEVFKFTRDAAGAGPLAGIADPKRWKSVASTPAGYIATLAEDQFAVASPVDNTLRLFGADGKAINTKPLTSRPTGLRVSGGDLLLSSDSTISVFDGLAAKQKVENSGDPHEYVNGRTGMSCLAGFDGSLFGTVTGDDGGGVLTCNPTGADLFVFNAVKAATPTTDGVTGTLPIRPAVTGTLPADLSAQQQREGLIAHELAHTVQQSKRQGYICGTTHLKNGLSGVGCAKAKAKAGQGGRFRLILGNATDHTLKLTLTGQVTRNRRPGRSKWGNIVLKSGKVTVRGWDPAKKKEIVGAARCGKFLCTTLSVNDGSSTLKFQVKYTAKQGKSGSAKK